MFDGMSMRDDWRELGVDWLIEAHQNLQIPDIAGLGVSTIVVSPKYSPLFLNDFSNNVELLECNLKGEKWFAFNVLSIVLNLIWLYHPVWLAKQNVTFLQFY